MNNKLTQGKRTVDDKGPTKYPHSFTALDVMLRGSPLMGISRFNDLLYPHPSLHSRPTQDHQLI